MLTGVHLVHLAGGLVWFAIVFTRLRRLAYAPGEDGLGLFAIYWHFLGGLWAYLLVCAVCPLGGASMHAA